jgi:hypothetical protein
VQHGAGRLTDREYLDRARRVRLGRAVAVFTSSQP